jgi:hypothetical protein
MQSYVYGGREWRAGSLTFTTGTRMRTSLCIIALLLLFAPQLCMALEQEQKEEKTRIYTWRDEHGVLHMKDTMPEHLKSDQSRMDQRDEFLKRHPDGAVIEGQELPGQDAERLERDETGTPRDPDQDALGRPGQEKFAFPEGAEWPSMRGVYGGIALVLAMAAALYLALTWVLYKLGRKFGVGAFWEYLIPVYNVVLLCRCAGLTPWFTLFMFLPVLNIFVTFLIWGKIAERLGKNMLLWGLLCTLLGLPVLILALDASKPVAAKKSAEFDEHIAI